MYPICHTVNPFGLQTMRQCNSLSHASIACVKPDYTTAIEQKSGKSGLTTFRLVSRLIRQNDHRRFSFNVDMEFALGGLAACGACFFTNPLDVVKTRMQLQVIKYFLYSNPLFLKMYFLMKIQGELRGRGSHAIFYKNSLHAFYVIAKVNLISFNVT